MNDDSTHMTPMITSWVTSKHLEQSQFVWIELQPRSFPPSPNKLEQTKQECQLSPAVTEKTVASFQRAKHGDALTKCTHQLYSPCWLWGRRARFSGQIGIFADQCRDRPPRLRWTTPSRPVSRENKRRFIINHADGRRWTPPVSTWSAPESILACSINPGNRCYHAITRYWCPLNMKFISRSWEQSWDRL